MIKSKGLYKYDIITIFRLIKCLNLDVDENYIEEVLENNGVIVNNICYEIEIKEDEIYDNLMETLIIITDIYKV